MNESQSIKFAAGDGSYFLINGIPHQRGDYMFLPDRYDLNNATLLSLWNKHTAKIVDDCNFRPIAQYLDINNNPFSNLASLLAYVAPFTFFSGAGGGGVAQVNSDWDSISGVSEILHKPSLNFIQTVNIGFTVAPLVGGLVPSGYLPAYVDEILTYANLAAFPLIGLPNKVYLAANTGFIYRWSGSIYVEISASPIIPTLVSAFTNDSGYIILADVTWANVSGKPTLATVATSGDYTDLSNLPSLADVALSGDYNDLINTPTIIYATSTRASNFTAAVNNIYFVSGNTTCTLPTAIGKAGQSVKVKRTGTNNVTIATTASQTIDGVATQVLTLQYTAIELISDGANWFIF